jgi:hypothetical protein
MLRGIIFSLLVGVSLMAGGHAVRTQEGKMSKPVSRYAPVNGLQPYYEVHGASKPGRVPLLLLHGGGSSIHPTWDEVIPLLSGNRQVIAFDD